jgi:membrane protease YdiL (CAAX protease family)
MLSVKPWRAQAVLFFIAAQSLCVLIGGMAIDLLQKAGVSGFKSLDDFGCILVGTLSFQGATWVLMGFFLRYHHVDWREELGFKNKNLLRSLLLALALVRGYFARRLMPLQSASDALMDKIGWAPKDEMAVTLLTNAPTPVAHIYLVLFAVVLAPVAEEFIFRGVLFPFLKQLGMLRTAWIGLNLFFAFIHGDAAIFLPLFALSVALTWLYEKTDNLLAPMLAHALFQRRRPGRAEICHPINPSPHRERI